ncbi:hypothetical protein CRM22_004690 [Opisthorchis felineus]|uniref:Uncharacterized protein n=1 Tax=Opisthorchis felineus TaxID=147828 RepID=A0A4S2LUV6_OPIFE|nr:hypothetical protein CRM22_004690 [Opisthorchis felineus]TGZ67604.1 hypothetical protein CRM22_004690 [Opisthorchis felineus]
MDIEKFAEEETSGYKHSSSSIVNCIFRQLVVDMATKMNMFEVGTCQSIMKSLFMAVPEAATSVYLNKSVTGEYLALPLVLAEKMLQVLPRHEFANFKVQLPDNSTEDSTLLTSEVVKELQGSGVTVETVLGYTIKKLVNYYESLGTELFCKLKAKVLDAFGPHSLSGLAFAGSHVHTCIAKLPKTDKTKAKKQA